VSPLIRLVTYMALCTLLL